MTSNDANDHVESPACVMRRILEAQNDLSDEQRDYMEKMEAYLDGPGHDQSA
ncbi:hypothetical protein [Sphingomonas abietis]|uniref:DUF3072 domain-containing protein n=1 Tax=Sphingomonas abietis TaxID=3012344 RepID=A0ABY7NQQ6_9SPHN|nr:hypothetical protein [Sphingomonas abietis]WBO23718.1 hypothetical protein PBT88_06240 [Sphingomonas abietis]